VKSVLTESKYKQQRNKVNNKKKQAKQKFYANIDENLNELKSANPYFHPLNLILKKKYLFKISAFSMDSSSGC
jgi:hypothetical protein